VWIRRLKCFGDSLKLQLSFFVPLGSRDEMMVRSKTRVVIYGSEDLGDLVDAEHLRSAAARGVNVTAKVDIADRRDERKVRGTGTACGRNSRGCRLVACRLRCTR
jgi:hypothetical protein